jgi:pimeloyl-ACP methyl ester carboxylesterase
MFSIQDNGLATRKDVSMVEFEVQGQGEPIVMVHGLGGTSNLWQAQARALSRQFKVIRPDLPGSGRSRHEGKLSIDGFVEELRALFEKQSIDKAVVIGHSLGTLIVQHFAAKYPEKVSKLILVGPVKAPADNGRQGPRDRAQKVRAEGMAAIADTIVAAATSPSDLVQHSIAPAMVREMLMRQPAEGYAATCEALSEAQEPDQQKIACPTLLVVGSDDKVGPPAVAREIASRIKNAKVTEVPNAGHWLTLEQPAEVTNAIESFLK